ncbi:MAG TPA: hypothetical protein GX011_00020 [Clostridiales bacterium]|jgi:hypothetical protein|nr:hypothetical protein [Clostridiales bacterium]
MAFTTYGSTQVLSGLIGKGSGPLSNCYIALSTTAPNADGTNFTEPLTSAGYARSIIGLSGTSATQVMSSPSGGATSNTSIIFFPEATASWGTVTHFGLFTSASGGNLVLYGTLTNPIAVAANYVPLFRVGNFSLTLS